MDRTRAWRALSLWSAVGGLCLGGCGGDSADNVATAPAPTTSATPSAPAASATPAAPAASATPAAPAASSPSAVPAPPPAPGTTACAAIYAAGFTPSTTRTIDPIAPMAKPVRGQAFADPAYRTCVVRANDHAADGIAGFTRNDYSRRQAFNANSAKYLIYALDGSWHVYDSATRQHVKRLQGPGGDAEPQWHATNPDILYYLPTNGVGMTVHELTVSTNTSRVVGDLGERLKKRWPGAAVAWSKSEGSPSRDRRHWCFQVEDKNFGTLGVVTWDRDKDAVLGMIDTNGDRPDHVSMSPSGNHCVVSGDGARGTVAYSRDLSTSRKLLNKSEHSDIALDAAGDDVYVSVDYQSAQGELFMLNLRTGARTALLPTYLAGTTNALHISGRAFDRPGWVVVSVYAGSIPAGGTRQWMHDKVFAMELKASPRTVNLAFHHSLYREYWTEPHATVNPDFTKVLFNSNWDVDTKTDVDAYLIELPPDLLK